MIMLAGKPVSLSGCVEEPIRFKNARRHGEIDGMPRKDISASVVRSFQERMSSDAYQAKLG
jgi:hypothetical protein